MRFLERLRYAHEHLFKVQSFIEAKNVAVLSASLLLLFAIADGAPSNNLAVFASLLAVLSALIATGFSALSFFPNVTSSSSRNSLVFFGDTEKYKDGADLQTYFQSQKESDEEADLAQQIVIVSKIIGSKTRNFRHAVIWFLASVFFYLSGLIHVMLIGGIHGA